MSSVPVVQPEPQEPARRGRPPRFTPEELLDRVVAEFNARGYDATSMEDVARATGMTKSAVYHHVAGKEALLHLALSRAVDALFAVLDEPGSTEGPAVDRLAHVVRRAAQVLADLLPYVTLLLRVRGNTATEQWALQRRRELDHRLTELVQEAIDAGALRRDLDPRLVSRLLFGMVNSVSEWYRPDGVHDADDVADSVVAMAFEGLLNR